MHRKAVGMALVAVALLAATVLYKGLPPKARWVESILAADQEQGAYGDIEIEYPLDGTVFPPEMIPPTFHWRDSTRASRRWLVRITLADGKPSAHFLVRRPQWTP